MLRKPFRTKQAPVHWMIRITPHADGFAVLHTHKHSATNRTVATRRGHPALGNFLRGRKPHHGIVAVRILLRENVETELSLERRHAAAFWLLKYEAAMFFGTTLMKNR